jgi:hypothetical protein
VLAQPKGGKPLGSLLEQLAQCQANSASLISEMNSTFKSRRDRSDMLLTLTTRSLRVGTCAHRFAGTARFFDTHVVYAFDHPRHRQVEMQMWYRDMASPAAPTGGTTFSFRVLRRLEYFDREYDFTDPAHELRLEFLNDEDGRTFRQRVLAHVQRVAASGKGRRQDGRPGDARVGGGSLSVGQGGMQSFGSNGTGGRHRAMLGS